MGSLIRVEPIETKQIEEKIDDAELLLRIAKGTIIKSDTEYKAVGELLQRVKGRYKELEKDRKEITQPLLKVKRTIDGKYKEPKKVLKKAEKILKDSIVKYQIEKAQERRKCEEEQRKVMEERKEKAEKEGAPVPVEPIPQEVEPEEPEGVYTRKKWYVEIVDEKKIPREYLIPDMKKLNAQAKATQDKIAVPGVEFKSKEIVVSRSK